MQCGGEICAGLDELFARRLQLIVGATELNLREIAVELGILARREAFSCRSGSIPDQADQFSLGRSARLQAQYLDELLLDLGEDPSAGLFDAFLECGQILLSRAATIAMLTCDLQGLGKIGTPLPQGVISLARERNLAAGLFGG